MEASLYAKRIGFGFIACSILLIPVYLASEYFGNGETSEFILLLLILGSVLSLCLGLCLVYFHAPALIRKRVIAIISAISGFFFLGGFLSKFMHWPGASFELLFSIFLFCCSGLPLIIKARYEKRRGLVAGRSLLLNVLDLLSIMLICIGFLGRLLHWPGGNWMLIGGVLGLVSGFVLWNILFRNEVKRRVLAEEQLKATLKQVEEKRLIIEEKNKEITDSITYARRIQQAILPPLELIRAHLPQAFVYYQPKDIVAGDFYWSETIGDIFLIAAADCTGHGVPGALVSVVCSNALNRSVKEFGLSDPGQILDKTRELVVEHFSKSKEEIKDGMDISLLAVKRNGAETTLSWAGANNPLWCTQSGSPGMPPSLLEVRANKQAIGFVHDPLPFRTHTLSLRPGDAIYLFTDGYADQFGGPAGKKYKYRQLEELLLSLHTHPVDHREYALKTALEAWQGSLEQVDDICVVGIVL